MNRCIMLGCLLFLVLPWIGPAAAAPDREAAAAREIRQLLATIGESSCSFIRNGTTHDAESARQHIERKYQQVKADIGSAEDFIRQTASKSSISGRRYRVLCGESEMDSSAWLRGKLQRLRTTQSTAVPITAPR